MRAIQAVSVTGATSVENMLALLGSGGDVVKAVTGLVDMGLLSLHNGMVSVTHQIIADTALRLAPTGAIESLHSKAADLLEESGGSTELYAYHAIRGRPDLGAFLVVEECARLRQSRGDLDGAIDVLREGMDAARHLMMRGDMETATTGLAIFGRKLGTVLLKAGRIDEAQGVLLETLDLTSPVSSARALVLEQLGVAAQLRRHSDKARSLFTDSAALARQLDDAPLMARLNELLLGLDAPSSFEISKHTVTNLSSGMPAPNQSQARLRMQLLVIDDDPVLSRAIGRSLRSRGYVVRTVTSYEEAEREQGPYVCAICDVNLPDGDGLALARNLRERGVVDKLVFFSGVVDPDVRRQADELGTFVPKGDGLAAVELVLDAVMRVSRPPVSVREEPSL